MQRAPLPAVVSVRRRADDQGQSAERDEPHCTAGGHVRWGERDGVLADRDEQAQGGEAEQGPQQATRPATAAVV